MSTPSDPPHAVKLPRLAGSIGYRATPCTAASAGSGSQLPGAATVTQEQRIARALRMLQPSSSNATPLPLSFGPTPAEEHFTAPQTPLLVLGHSDDGPSKPTSPMAPMGTTYSDDFD